MAYTIFDYIRQVHMEELKEADRKREDRARKRRLKLMDAELQPRHYGGPTIAEVRRMAERDEKLAAEKRKNPPTAAKNGFWQLVDKKTNERLEVIMAGRELLMRQEIDRKAKEQAQALAKKMAEDMAEGIVSRRSLPPPLTVEAAARRLAEVNPDQVFAAMMEMPPVRARAHAYAMRVALQCLQRLLSQQALCGCCSAMNEPVYAAAGEKMKNAARVAC